MANTGRTRQLLALMTSGALIFAASVPACSVPVFRYALEKWPSDPYQAVVFHRGGLSEAQQAIAKDLGNGGLAGEVHANISIRTVDLDQDPIPELLELWRKAGTGTLPWVILRYPPAIASKAVIWSGPLDRSAVPLILDSPARKEIAERLAAGESAVWVFLESGDPGKDSAVAELLKTRLAYLGTNLQLPKLDAKDVAEKLVSVSEDDLRLSFSSLRVSRKDPAEQAFIKMLLGTEADLKDSTEPIVFPVFGRGRALYALIGKGINQQTIDQAAMFLIGKCSCEVKELNPGVDLLMAADWENLMKTQVRDLPVIANLPGLQPETVTISGVSATNQAPDGIARSGEKTFPLRKAGLATAVIGALIGLGLFFYFRK